MSCREHFSEVSSFTIRTRLCMVRHPQSEQGRTRSDFPKRCQAGRRLRRCPCLERLLTAAPKGKVQTVAGNSWSVCELAMTAG